MAKTVRRKKLGLAALKPGDIVDVIAPGFPCSLEDLEKARAYLESKGFKPRIPSEIIENHPLFANTDQKRTKMLIQALKAADSKAVWCLRGGYGSNHLLPALRKLKKLSPKIFVGISDITSLHGFLIQKWKWSGLHGSLLDRLGKGQVPAELESELFDVVTGQKQEVIFSSLTALNRAALKKKKIISTVLGGNLTVIHGHVGTSEAFRFRDRIVFFEEIGERGYRVDRMLFHLSEAKAFEGCQAVIFGTFIGGNEPKSDPDQPSENKVDWVLKSWAEQQKFPVLKGLPCGHDTIQRVLPLGTRAELILGSQSELKVETGVGSCD